MDVLVVGGGVAGLTAAFGAARQGMRVCVLESSDRLGGRAASSTDETTGDRVDLGPHVLFEHYPSFLGLLDELGTSDRVVWQDDPHLTIMYGLRPVRSTPGTLPPPLHFIRAVLSHEETGVIDMLRDLPVAIAALATSKEELDALDEVDALSFLRALGATESSIEALFAFIAHSVLNTPLERCSAAAFVRLMRLLLGHRGSRFGFPVCGLAELFTSVASELEERESEVRLHAEVIGLIGAGGRVTGVSLRDGAELTADHVVVTVPPAALLRLLDATPAPLRPPLAGLTCFEPVSYVSAYLWLDHRLGNRAFWARPYDPSGLGCDFYDLANIRGLDTAAPSLVAVNVIDSERLGPMSDEEIMRGLVAELAETFPSVTRSSIRHARLHRVPMAVPAAHPGVERRRPTTKPASRGLYLAGDWTATGLPFSMESAALSGWLAAEEVIAAAGMPRPTLAKRIGPPEGLARVAAEMARRLGFRPARIPARIATRRFSASSRL